MAILNFSDVLKNVGLDPKRVKLIRHSLGDKAFKKCYDKNMVEEYTRVQSETFSNGYDYWCVFISDKSTTAKFFACYKVSGGVIDTQDTKPKGFPLEDWFQGQRMFYNLERIDFIDQPVPLGFDCPLDLHCTYTRDQILIAMDYMAPKNVREGVKWLPDKQVDVFFITLNKADKDYSPTTMYNDYSINESLFHWQSQSRTSDTASTGQRYINHRQRGSRVVLFVREFKQDSIGAAPYTCLGTAAYVKHTGSKPMNITWHLDQPIPAKYLRKTNKLVVG